MELIEIKNSLVIFKSNVEERFFRNKRLNTFNEHVESVSNETEVNLGQTCHLIVYFTVMYSINIESSKLYWILCANKDVVVAISLRFLFEEKVSDIFVGIDKSEDVNRCRNTFICETDYFDMVHLISGKIFCIRSIEEDSEMTLPAHRWLCQLKKENTYYLEPLQSLWRCCETRVEGGSSCCCRRLWFSRCWSWLVLRSRESWEMRCRSK